MQVNGGGRARRALRRLFRPGMLLVALGALALTACNSQSGPNFAGTPRGATVAFESIDGLPPVQFDHLVEYLNDEAKGRQLAVTSRESVAAYRVRGYLAAKVSRKQITVAWVWDVFGGDNRRALRISGEETAKGDRRDAWSAANDAMLQRIARSSMDQLAAFLTSPEVAPGTPNVEPRLALAGERDYSPEANGIVRIVHPDSPPEVTETPAAKPGPVPLPRRRPSLAALAVPETLTLAASGHR